MENYERAKQSFYFYKFTGTAGGFETALWDAFARADEGNLVRLGVGFPSHFKVFNEWRSSSSEREYFSEYLKEKF